MKKFTLFAIILVLAACSSAPSEEDIQTAIAKTNEARPTRTSTRLSTPSQTPTLIPTSYSTPTLSPSPSNSPTIIITPDIVTTAFIIPDVGNIRSGPGMTFNIVDSAIKGESVPIYAKNSDGSWFLIKREEENWVSSSIVEIFLDTSNIPLAPTPLPSSTPTKTPTKPPTSTPKEKLSSEYGCKSAWMKEEISEMKFCVKSVYFSEFYGDRRAAPNVTFLAVTLIAIGDTELDEKIADHYFSVKNVSYSRYLAWEGVDLFNCNHKIPWPYNCSIDKYVTEEITVLFSIPEDMNHEGLRIWFALSNEVKLPE